MIENLIFDFGKVLVDYDFKVFIASIVKDPVAEREFFATVCDPVFVDRCDKGEVTLDEIVSELMEKYPHWSAEIQEFYERQLDVVSGEIEGMPELLDRLKEQGFKLFGLTNWSSAVYPVIEKFSIFRKLDGALISSEEKLIKPDIAIYRRLCEKFGLKAEECLFTDDKQVNVEGAIKAGMNAVVFTDCKSFESYLMKHTKYESQN